MPVVRVILREDRKAVPRGPGLDSYAGSHVTDYPQSRQYRRVSIRVLPLTVRSFEIAFQELEVWVWNWKFRF